MKILHITFSNKGGAAIGIKRLHYALKKKNIKSKIFFYNKYLEDNKKKEFFNVHELLWKLKVFIKRLLLKFTSVRLSKETVSLNWLNNINVSKIHNFESFDIIHLHWIGNEMISIKEISLIDKPIVWTLHDMWPFCGAEHFSYKHRHIKQYSPSSRNVNEKGFDFDNYIWKLKKKYLQKKKLNFISPSNWMKTNLIKSNLFKNYNIKTLPYIININQNTIIKKNKKNKKIILLFSATSSVNYRKGFNYLVNAINKYLDKNKFILHVVGDKPKLFNNVNIEKKFFGNIKSQKTLKKIYSSSDIFVLPSIAESFGQVFIEAGSKGLPCICFKNTACTEIIKHKINGYSARFKSSRDLAFGINWCQKNLLNSKSKNNIINMTYKNFSSDKIVEKYIRYYEEIYSN
jgi:glycosyltransferase involved in cell wall biosynthesis